MGILGTSQELFKATSRFRTIVFGGHLGFIPSHLEVSGTSQQLLTAKSRFRPIDSCFLSDFRAHLGDILGALKDQNLIFRRLFHILKSFQRPSWGKLGAHAVPGTRGSCLLNPAGSLKNLDFLIIFISVRVHFRSIL